jgi:probable F420-dependent oxidoreductase
VQAAAELEGLGWGAIWLPEVLGRDPFIHATELLPATERLWVATGIANIYARDPLAALAAANSVVEGYGDRFCLGLGASHRAMVETYRGQQYRSPLSAMRAYLDGLESAQLPMTPAPAACAPVVLGALGPKMLQLAAERTDGALTYNVTPQHTARAREILGPEPVLCSAVAAVLEEDATTARDLGRRFLAPYLRLENYTNNWLREGFSEDDFTGHASDRLIDELVAWGSVDRVVARLHEHLSAGADHVAVQVYRADGAPLLDEWRTLADALDLQVPAR